jgi:hypothetical protein
MEVQAPIVQQSFEEITGISTTAIQPATITEVKTVTKFFVQVVSLELFKSVTVMATLLTAEGNTVSTQTITVEGAEYAAWNNDDQYLVDLVAQKLGFTLA